MTTNTKDIAYARFLFSLPPTPPSPPLREKEGIGDYYYAHASMILRISLVFSPKSQNV